LRKTHLIVILMICIIGVVTACAKQDEKNQSTQKEYALVVDETSRDSSATIPSLTINTSDKTFSFAYDSLSSYLSVGTYEISDSILTASTDDGERTYIFSIVDDNTLKFVAKGSFEMKLTDDRIGTLVTDQAIFKLVN